jgi:hypothetical protein
LSLTVREPTGAGAAVVRVDLLTFNSVCADGSYKYIVIKVSEGFTQTFYANVGIIPQTRPRSLHSASSPIHHSPVILQFDAI